MKEKIQTGIILPIPIALLPKDRDTIELFEDIISLILENCLNQFFILVNRPSSLTPTDEHYIIETIGLNVELYQLVEYYFITNVSLIEDLISFSCKVISVDKYLNYNNVILVTIEVEL